ncbi:hypothetical protein [Bordetella genomosp. 1]|uniref:Uncharacterized protein n=1 Tax=Bordetella genomosp. 1 TaxID=1395607 RepID=A0ABX4EWX8_9BORD|nr:hypothetical protein [Bordetella genomosp. 1]OZI58974.1 hypothetical protein CAL27_20145 [Bordetella genomosp. 1]
MGTPARRQVIKAVCIGIGLIGGGVLLGIGIAGLFGLRFMPQTSGDFAAWLQSVGSIAAVAVAYFIGADQAALARKQAAVQDQAAEDLLRVLRLSLVSVISVFRLGRDYWASGGHFDRSVEGRRRADFRKMMDRFPGMLQQAQTSFRDARAAFAEQPEHLRAFDTVLAACDSMNFMLDVASAGFLAAPVVLDVWAPIGEGLKQVMPVLGVSVEIDASVGSLMAPPNDVTVDAPGALQVG